MRDMNFPLCFGLKQNATTCQSLIQYVYTAIRRGLFVTSIVLSL